MRYGLLAVMVILTLILAPGCEDNSDKDVGGPALDAGPDLSADGRARLDTRTGETSDLGDAARDTWDPTPLPIAWCNLDHPTDLYAESGAELGTFYGRVLVPGLTDQSPEPDRDPRVLMQLGLGPVGTSAETWTLWYDAMPGDSARDDLHPGADTYEATFGEPVEQGAHDFTFRASGDHGETWTYCNATRLPHYDGTDADNPYDPEKNGLLWIHGGGTDPCVPNPCREPFRSVCTNDQGYPSCHCDGGYHEDGGLCIPDQRTIPCTNQKPDNSSWVADGSHDGAGNVLQSWDNGSWEPGPGSCPWECNPGFIELAVPAAGAQCFAQQTVPCTNDLPQHGVWLEQSGGGACPNGGCSYNGDGTVTQLRTNGQWAPAPNECPWECGEGYLLFQAIPLAPLECISIQTVPCTNEKPEGSHWTPEIDEGRCPDGECGYNGDGTVTRIQLGGQWGPDQADCPWECHEGRTVYESSSNLPRECVPVRTLSCTNEKPQDAIWTEELWTEVCPLGWCGYPGDGTAAQLQLGGEWGPSEADCPWECAPGYIGFRIAPTLPWECVQARTLTCTNTKPESAHWTVLRPGECQAGECGFNGDGTFTQLLLGGFWSPLDLGCPWECDQGFTTIGTGSAATCVEVRTIPCTNELPENAHWVELHEAACPDQGCGYNGNGTVTQILVLGQWTPPENECRWECEQGLGVLEPGPELYICAPSRTVSCDNSKPEHTRWTESHPEQCPTGACGYNGDGTMSQLQAGGLWIPMNLGCPWECEAGFALHQVTGAAGECVPSQNVPCQNVKPEGSHWVSDLWTNYPGNNVGYLGDGTVGQIQDGELWVPEADNCPWECDTGVDCGTPRWRVWACGIGCGEYCSGDNCYPMNCMGPEGDVYDQQPIPVSAYHWCCTQCQSTRISFPDGSWVMAQDGHHAEYFPSSVVITRKY